MAVKPWRNVTFLLQEEEALALALANGTMSPGNDLPPEEEEDMGYPEDEAQRASLEEVGKLSAKGQNHSSTF